MLKVRDFFQMAGRGGRRGIDKQGFVYSRVNPAEVKYQELKHIFEVKPEPIRSKFNASYATILNLYEVYGEDLLKIYTRSFHYFQAKNRSNLTLMKSMETKLKILKKLCGLELSKITRGIIWDFCFLVFQVLDFLFRQRKGVDSFFPLRIPDHIRILGRVI